MGRPGGHRPLVRDHRGRHARACRRRASEGPLRHRGEARSAAAGRAVLAGAGHGHRRRRAGGHEARPGAAQVASGPRRAARARGPRMGSRPEPRELASPSRGGRADEAHRRSAVRPALRAARDHCAASARQARVGRRLGRRAARAVDGRHARLGCVARDHRAAAGQRGPGAQGSAAGATVLGGLPACARAGRPRGPAGRPPRRGPEGHRGPRGELPRRRGRTRGRGLRAHGQRRHRPRARGPAARRPQAALPVVARHGVRRAVRRPAAGLRPPAHHGRRRPSVERRHRHGRRARLG